MMVSDAVKTLVIELYGSGISLLATSQVTALPFKTVYSIVQDAGIVRPAGGRFGWKRQPFTKEHLQRLSESHIGQKAWNLGVPHSEETKQKLADVAWRSYKGGAAGDVFASFLLPAGFVREHRVFWAVELALQVTKRQHKFFSMDFAHVEGKVNIELDGPRHKTTPEEDWQRDAMLRYLGWKIIRIKHGKDF